MTGRWQVHKSLRILGPQELAFVPRPTTFYRQCHVVRGPDEFTSWLPERYAKSGMVLDFKVEGRGWKVIEVYDTRLSEEQMRTMQDQSRRMSEVLDGGR